MYDNIPLLTPADVQLRVAQLQQTSYGTYAVLLCYKDSRVDMKILDEVYGPLNWKKEHTMIGDNIFCTISVYDPEKQEWIPKTDVGTESNTEATKGAVSDSMKRSAVLWGIGRELYQAPVIRFKLNDNELVMGATGRPKTYAHFTVGTMKYDKEKNCFTEFTVLDVEGNVRFSLRKSQPFNKPVLVQSQSAPTEEDVRPPTSTTEVKKTENVCTLCGNYISNPKIITFSKQRYHRILCYDCQRSA